MAAGALIEILKRHKFFSDFFTEKSISQFKKYLVTGFTSFSIEWTLFFVLLKVLSINDKVANVIVYVIMFWLVFLVNRFWSFQSKGNMGEQLFFYIILFTVNLVVGNIGLWHVFTRVFGIPALISKPLLQGVLISWNFIVYKKVIYRT
ncbi:MAG: GtrA family protein [Bacillota bacterium]